MARIVECPHCGAEVDHDRAKLCPKCMRDISRKPARPRPVRAATESDAGASEQTGDRAAGGNEGAPRRCLWEDCQARLTQGAESCPYCERAVEPQDDGAVLQIVVGGAEAELPEGETVVIGRDSSPLGEALRSLDHISRRHLRIEHGEDGVWITDMGSSNGSYVEGRRLEPWQREHVEPGSSLRLASNVTVDLHIDRGSVRAA